MGLKDLIITPIYLILFSVIAYFVRPYVTNAQTKKYFLPALWARFAGAIALGLIYQFYYDGGDTFAYWEHGSQWIYKAFHENPLAALQLIFGPNNYTPDNFQFSQHIWFFFDSDSYFVTRIAGFFDILTFGTYSTTALFFAIFSFSGAWALFSKMVIRYPGHSLHTALILLFTPSIIFWGSGILKDSLSLGSLYWLVYSLLSIYEERRIRMKVLLILILSSILLMHIKPYILYCIIPPTTLWMYIVYVGKIRNSVSKVLVAPLILIFFTVAGYFSLEFLTQESNQYSLDSIARRAWITAYDIRYYTGRNAGSGYSLGEQDGTFEGMIKLMPEAVFVSLFRPFFWEIKNPLMALMSVESLISLVLAIRFMISGRLRWSFRDPFLIFCISYALLFGFAVGVSTYNFGTLMRYKIPMMAFFLTYVTIGVKPKRLG